MVSSGNYAITVTDANQCADTIEIHIAQPDALSFIALVTANHNQQVPNGSISLDSINGGSMPYFYEWSTGSMESELNGLTQGVYTVTISDSNGCTNIGSFEVPFVLDAGQPANIIARIFPNPTTGLLMVSLPEATATVQLEITDMAGRILRSQLLPYKDNQVSLKGFDPGVLILVIKEKGRVVHTEKVLLL